MEVDDQVNLYFNFFLFNLVWFYGTSTLVGYIMPNLFLYVLTVLFLAIKFSMSTQFQCKKNPVLFQTIQFSISMQFKCQNSHI